MNNIEVWKEYEKIAMHFNTLLIQLRIRALATIAVIITILTYISKTFENISTQATILGISLIILSFIWIAIFTLDIFYYNKLLLGAVKAIIDLEEGKEKNIKFSSTVKDIVNEKTEFITPISIFYLIIYILLLGGGLVLLYKF